MKVAKVDVTLDDIQHGERAECSRCPIARALWRLYPDALLVSAAEYVHAHFADEDDDTKVKLFSGRAPAEAISFMNKFDGGHPVSPFSFEVTLYPA